MAKGVYNVTCAVYANMLVEAENPQEAMRIAEKYKDEYLTDEDFEDSNIGIDSCDSYPESLDWLESSKNVFCDDRVLTVEEYIEEQENGE